MLSSSPSSTYAHPPQRSHNRSMSGGAMDHVVYTPTASSEKLTLPEFVSQYHKTLPLPIRVVRGYCGPSEETSISEGDHFSVHFVKHTTVVLVEMDNGHQYTVPLNSAVPFGILFDPNKNLSQASKGYTFTKVADILQLPEFPNVVRARKAHVSSNPENSIVANELLIIRRAARKRIGKNQLKVFSLTDKKEKTLSESCIGHFSTKPRDVSLYLPDIVKHAPDIFPCRAILFANKETAQAVPSKLTSTAVTLMHHSIETSLVVTSALDEDTENSKMLDIPIDLNIQVRVATVTEVEAQKLARSTAYLYDHFNPSQLRSFVHTARSQRMEETQNLLYRTVRHDHCQKGIKITRPSILIPNKEKTSSSSPDTGYPAENLYDDVKLVGEPHYMTPRPVGTSPLASPDGPPLPDRSLAPKRTPGYSYVDMDNFRRGAPKRATRAVGAAAVSSEGASGDSSFGSTGSGGAVVERSMSEVCTGGRQLGRNATEFSSRSSYSEGDLEVRRVEEQRKEKVGKEKVVREKEVRERLSVQEQELDTFLMDLREMAEGLDSVLQEGGGEGGEVGRGGEREGEDDYSTLQHKGPQRRISNKSPPLPRRHKPSTPDDRGSDGPLTWSMESGQELSEDMKQQNRTYVKSLGTLQILKMLQTMGLSQYKDVFSSQQINGDLLLECDDKMLQNDLHISSKLHRVRLLRVISGNYSVSDILSGRDGYVTMHPCK